MTQKCYCRLVLMVTGDGYSDQSPPGFLLSIQTAQVPRPMDSQKDDSSSSDDSDSSDSAGVSLPDYAKDKAKIPLHKWTVKHTVLFGCGEGSRRCLNEQHVKLRTLRAICLTNDHLNSISGIPSTLFHMGDTGCKEVTVCGPGDIQNTMNGVNETFGRKYPITTVEKPGRGEWRGILSMHLYDATEKTKGCPNQHVRLTTVDPTSQPLDTRERSTSDSSSQSSETSSDTSSSSSCSSDISIPDQQKRRSGDLAGGDSNTTEREKEFMNSLRYKIRNAKRSADELVYSKSIEDCCKAARSSEEASHPMPYSGLESPSTPAPSSVYCVQLVLDPSERKSVPLALVIDIDTFPQLSSYERLFAQVKHTCVSRIHIVLFSSVRSHKQKFDKHACQIEEVFNGLTVNITRIGQATGAKADNRYLFTFWKAANLQAQLSLFDNAVYPFPMLDRLSVDHVENCEQGQFLRTLDTVELWPSFCHFNQSTEHVAPQSHFENLGWKDLVSSNVQEHTQVNGELKKQKIAETMAQTKAAISNESLGSGKTSNEVFTSAVATMYILGTGASTPGKYRSNTGIYLSLDPLKLAHVLKCGYKADVAPQGILLDCGEGVLAGFSRLFESKKKEVATDNPMDLVLKGIQIIWISHHHTDHHSGLLSLLGRRQEVLQQGESPNLLLVCPPKVRKSIEYYRQGISSRLNPFYSVTMVDTQDFNNPLNPQRQGFFSASRCNGTKVSCESTVTSFLSVPVEHCPDAYGVVLILNRRDGDTMGTKIVFSGDTRPCKRLIAAGSGASLLIHEATFDDSMGSHAVRKRHCTISEALDVGEKMRSPAIVLTHFSQRYSKIGPELPSDSNSRSSRKAVFCNAYDGMQLNLNKDGSAILDSCSRANAAEKLLRRVDEELAA
eukprot:gb/GECG01012253.1/.p1 GENE.gb/GECG01012253.1/~~gb/GECG01012253.1/.p1  ORF type:complete len:895 (+),score=81.89 gb/GECG01012253.1/:1-2685(+)